MNNIKIVYYIYLNPQANWKAIISGQLSQLKGFGILSEADLFIHVTDCFTLLSEAMAIIKEIVPQAIISYNHENQFEYPALNLIYELANMNPTANFIYFHTKGMSHNIQTRSLEEKTLFTKTFENWGNNIAYLNKNGIKKIGLFPAIWLEKFGKTGEFGGWIWYNFWYATGDYLAHCPKPLANMNRYYYESWLAKHKANECYIVNDCMSLYDMGFIKKQYFTPSEADFYLNLKIKKYNTPIKKILQKMGSHLLAHWYFQTRILVDTIRNNE